MAQLPPIVALKGAEIVLGATTLFSGVDMAIGRGDKVALVGRNGSGKSTLLKALAGIVDLDRGERFVQPGARITYLQQEPDFSRHATVGDFVAAGTDETSAYKVAAVLEELRLPAERATATLSGGEARRAAIAQALVSEPDVLLMDEPTNHLDLPTIEYLEQALQAFRGGLLLISHDRAFLNHLARRTLWLDRGVMRESERPFTEFEAWRDEVFASEEASAARLDRKIATETVWLRQGISARRTRNMGRVRALMSLRKERANRVRQGNVKLAVAEADISGRLVIEAVAISKSFPPTGDQVAPRPIVRDFSTRIMRGDRVGLIGPNGAGKTTLLKLLLGELAPDAGDVRLGTNLEIITFDQRRAQLDPNQTIRQVMLPYGGDSVVVGGTPRHIASYMRDFLFDGSMLEQPVRALSGGERNRLLLARLFAQPSNLMVLDEPTNDLDMDTLDLLEEVLADYPGTLLLVSHDRDFLDRLVTSTIAVEGDGVVAEYPGGYSDYFAQRPAVAKPAKAASQTAQTPASTPAPQTKVKRKLGYQQQRELDQLPTLLDTLGTQAARLEKVLADPGFYARDPAAFAKATAELERTHGQLAQAEDRWLELEALREELENG